MTDAERKKILIAEDDPATCKILETTIEKWGYDVIATADGSEAWKIFQTDPDIHIIVSDWMMPEIDGVELCKLVRGAPDRRYTYFIILTAKSQIDDIISGLESGADDFVTKPFNQLELKVRILAGERLIDLETQLANKVDELSLAYSQMRSDLEAAASIQRSMLPARTGQIKTVRYSASFIPCEEIGGDMFNIVELADSKVGLYIFDVSGHGVPAALQSVAMGRILSPFNPEASLLLDPPTDGNLDPVVAPSDVVNRLNIRFQSASSKGDFITFLYGVVDHESRIFTYTRAGHPAPIHISGGKVVDIDDKGDIPIGIVPDYDYVDNVLQLEPGDRLFFFTDGIPEASSEDGERFSEERMVNHLAEFSELSIERCLTRLVKAVKTWQKKDTGDDDMTIMGIEMGS